VVVDTNPPVIDGFSLTSIVPANLNITSDVVNADPSDLVTSDVTISDIINSDVSQNDVINSEVTGILTNPYKISATWNAVSDLESEITTLSACASTSKGDCNLSPSKSVDLYSSGLSFDFSTPLKTGTVFMVQLKAKNSAGLETTEYSSSIIVDDTPPLKGTIKVGDKETIVFMEEGESLSASWSDFVDGESTIKMYQSQVCSASQPSKCVSEFVNVEQGRRSLVINDVGIEQGEEYNLVIKALNFAEMETTAASNPFILDKTPPESGVVFDGDEYLKDKVYQSSSEEISVNWRGFKDKESGISVLEHAPVSAMSSRSKITAWLPKRPSRI
jgi:hypothetical protein